MLWDTRPVSGWSAPVSRSASGGRQLYQSNGKGDPAELVGRNGCAVHHARVENLARNLAGVTAGKGDQVVKGVGQRGQVVERVVAHVGLPAGR